MSYVIDRRLERQEQEHGKTATVSANDTRRHIKKAVEDRGCRRFHYRHRRRFEQISIPGRDIDDLYFPPLQGAGAKPRVHPGNRGIQLAGDRIPAAPTGGGGGQAGSQAGD